MVTVLLTLAASLAPGAYVRWRDRAIERHADDPALPELLLARQQRTALALLAALLVAAVAGGVHALWGVPLAIVGVLAATHRTRRLLHGETWGLGAYLRYHVVAFVGGYGFWLLLGLAPLVVAAAAGRRADLALAAAAALALVLLAWERAFAPLWLLAHRASPLGPEALGAPLHARLQAIVARSRAAAPALHRFGAPGMRQVSAVALPSRRRPRVAFSDTLLEVLDEEETAAVFAHEVAHVEEWTPARLRQARLAALLLVVLVCGTYPLLLVVAPRVAGWAPGLLPLVVVVGLALRAARMQGHETASDLRAAELCGSAEAMARALVKLHLHARIPRRWPHDYERAASHPSLQRRLQALAALGAGGESDAADAEPATVAPSSEAGRWVALDATRAHWFDGVEAPGDAAPPTIAGLREQATASRTLAYSQLAELRIAAAGEARALVAATTAGETWRVPLVAADVAALQRRLDRVDHRLGRRRASDARLDRVVPRLVAAMLVLSIVLLPAPGAALLVFLAAFAWPGLATFAAAGVTALASALAAASDLYGVGAADPEVTLLAFLVVGGVGALLVAARWWRLRRAGAAAPAERPVVALALLAAVAVAAWGWTRSPADGPRHLLMLLAGGGAGAATLGEARRRRAGLALAGLSAAGLAWAELARHAGGAPRLAWRDGSLAQAFEVPLRATGQLALSPHARAFAVHEYADDDDDPEARPRDARFEVGRFGAAPRELRALAVRFLDDDRLLVLRAAGDSLRLEVEPVSGAEDASDRWQVALPRMLAPRLALDRATGRWQVVGYERGGVIARAGAVGSAAVETERGAALPGIPLYTARDGATYLASVPVGGGLQALRAATGRLRWELTRLSAGERRLLARVDGYPACEGLGDGRSVVCATMGPARSTIWRFGPGEPSARPLATLPRGGWLPRVSAEGVVASLRPASGDVYLTDVVASRGVRVRLRREPGDSPLDVQAADGWLGVLRYGRGGVRLVLYRVGS